MSAIDFAESPAINEVLLVPTWVDPVTGLECPKQPTSNLMWRRAMLEAADGDKEFQAALYSASAKSLVFWINAFVYTLREFEIGEDGKQVQAEHREVPFCTWPKQDELLLQLERCMDKGESLLVEKTRDMGATWMEMAVLTHRFLFKPRETHLVMSRKEEMVDSLSGTSKNYPYGVAGAESTLMGKVDYILSRLPSWMLPKKMHRKLLHLVNGDNRCRIDGESSNATAGSGDRRTSIFLDEFAKMDEAESIKRATRDVTACRIIVSTPNGPGTTFSKWAVSGTIPKFTLNWWHHPEKCKGIYVKQEANGRFKIRSPWYDNEAATRSPKELAIEIDIDHVGSGENYFEHGIIEEHKKLFAKPPRQTLDIRFDKKLTDELVYKALSSCRIEAVIVQPIGSWRIWTRLIDGRLDQTFTYSLGVDISKGQGASNSVVSVVCNETGEKVAEYANANVPPYEFAKLVCAACIWIGGRNRRPLLIFENNGDPGHDFGRQLMVVYRYANVYFDRRVGTLNEKAGKRYGWRSSTEKKSQALGLLRRAYAHGKFVNHSAEALDECLSYIQFANGSIGPAGLLEESESARKAHGDRVIADMLAVWALQDMPKFKREMQESKSTRTFAGRLKEWKQDRNNLKTAKYGWEKLCR